MDDQQAWNQGVTRLKSLLAGFPAGSRAMLTQLLARYRTAKEALSAAVAAVGAVSVCRECAGQCCMNGKYRINVLDTLARIAAQIRMPPDFSQKPLCPYGTDAGCSTGPNLRPADCIVFVCDAIDRKLAPQARMILAEQEQILRGCIREASTLAGEPLGTPLLLWADKSGTESKSKG